MKLTLRRIGNSLGVIIPKDALVGLGLGEGDSLELRLGGIRPANRARHGNQELDELKRAISLAVVRQFSPREIRAQILANLSRWRRQDLWISAYDEWRELAQANDDGDLFAAMIGRDEEAVRMRQSMPYAGLLSPREVKALNDESVA